MLEGSWADVSIFGEDNEGEGTEDRDSALTATLSGLIAEVAGIPAATQEDILEDLIGAGVLELPSEDERKHPSLEVLEDEM